MSKEFLLRTFIRNFTLYLSFQLSKHISNWLQNFVYVKKIT